MILVNSIFWQSVGVVNHNGNNNGTQADFYNNIEMSNGKTIYNQYDFFINSPVDNVYYNNQYEWYKAIGAFHSEPIYDQYSFMQNVTFDGVNAVGNQYEFFKKAFAGLHNIFIDYGFLNMWSSENTTVAGTTTILHDYGGEHDLTNPAASNQATFNASGFGSESKPYLLYDGIDDFNYKSVSDWRSGDSLGVFIGVYETAGGVFNTFLMTGDELTNDYWVYNQLQVNTFRFGIKSVSTNTLHGTSNINDGSEHIASYSSNGSTYKIIVDGVSESLTVLAGSNNGDWMSSSPTQRDNIVIGGFKSSSSSYANIKWAMSGYLPYTNDATIVNLHNELKLYYGII